MYSDLLTKYSQGEADDLAFPSEILSFPGESPESHLSLLITGKTTIYLQTTGNKAWLWDHLRSSFFPVWWLVYSPRSVVHGFLQTEIFQPVTSSGTLCKWMSVCFLPYSKKLLRCERHLVPSHCHDCKTEFQALISSCFFLLLNFLGVHRVSRRSSAIAFLCYAVNSQPKKCFISCHLWSFFLQFITESSWKSFVFECSLSCETQIWATQDSLCEGFL